MIVFEKHFKDRKLDPKRYNVSWDVDVATFLLFNLSGQIVGYQQYRPFAPKTMNNDPHLGRYYTYVSKIHGLPGNRKANELACWGLETFNYRQDILFITEGIFDSCVLHNFGFPSIALLTNDPKQFSGWLTTIRDRVKIAICDNDDAGRKLAKMGDYAIFTEKKDLGEMAYDEVATLIKKVEKCFLGK